MKVLMLDVDGVLVHPRSTEGLPPAAGSEAELAALFGRLQETFFEPFWEAIVTGREPLLDRLAMVLARIAPDTRPQALIDYWFAKDASVDLTVLEAVTRCRRRGIRVFLATNQEHLRAAYLMQNLHLAKHVDGIIYSAALGHRKPDPAFYLLAARRAQTAASEILLVDDTLRNIDAARAVGWHALHWLGADRFDDALRAALS